MDKVKKFVRDHKEEIVTTSIILATSSLVFTAGYLTSKNAWSISDAVFDEFSKENDKFAVLRISHANRKTTVLNFTKKP